MDWMVYLTFGEAVAYVHFIILESSALIFHKWSHRLQERDVKGIIKLLSIPHPCQILICSKNIYFEYKSYHRSFSYPLASAVCLIYIFDNLSILVLSYFMLLQLHSFFKLNNCCYNHDTHHHMLFIVF